MRQEQQITNEQKQFIKKLYITHGNNIPFWYGSVGYEFDREYNRLFPAWWAYIIPREYLATPRYETLADSNHTSTASLSEEGIRWLMN